MNTFVLVLLIPLGVYLGAVCGYLSILAVGAWLYRKGSDPTAPTPRAAVIVPAHNEADHIATLVANLLSLDYPADQATVYVIADNCDDGTAERAREAGAAVLERIDPENRGKGQALDWFIRSHEDELRDFEMLVFIDADMVVDTAFLREMSASLAVDGIEVVQGQYRIHRPESSWRSSVGFASFAVVNHVRPAGRCWLGGTADLKGSGMAFRTELLLRYGWPAHSIVEDMEFGKALLLDDVKVSYNPDAVVSSELPETGGQAAVQQKRWERGNLYLLRTFFPRYVKRLAQSPSLALLDALVALFVPPQSVIVMLLIVSLGASAFVDVVWMGYFGLCFLSVAACNVTGLIQLRAPLRVWLNLCAIPLFLLWKVPLVTKTVIQRKDLGWQRTPRKQDTHQE